MTANASRKKHRHLRGHTRSLQGNSSSSLMYVFHSNLVEYAIMSSAPQSPSLPFMLLSVGAMVLRQGQRDEAAEETSTKASLFTKDFVVSMLSLPTTPGSHGIYTVYAEGTTPPVLAISEYPCICYRDEFKDFGNEIISGSDDG